jgi:hypothetical protein
MRPFGGIALAATVLCAIDVASAAPREELADAARAFDEAVLRNEDDNSKQSGVRKWTGPIKVAFRNSGMAPTLVQPTLKAIRSIADVAGLQVSEVESSDPGANFVIVFHENENAGKLNCLASAQLKNWAIVRADIKINPSFRGRIDNCIIHEALHAFGFLSHPHAADSVLSYVYARPTLTALDVNLIKALYDPAMKPGSPPAKATVLGCQLMAKLMSSSAADTQEVCAPVKRAQRSQAGESFEWATATLKRTTGKCAETVVYWVDLYPNRVSIGLVDGWHSVSGNASGAFGTTFTVPISGKPNEFKLSGNLKSRALSVENLTQNCAWEGKLD